MEKIENYINGEFVGPREGKHLQNFNPATGKAYSLIPQSQKEDVEASIKAAQKAFPMWSAMPVEKRSHYLRMIAAEIHRRVEELALAESVDSGKPLSLARELEIPRSARNFEFFADTLVSFHNEAYATDRHTLNYTATSAVGPVACISPWNLPLYLLSWKIAPALAAGCTVVAKPSEVTPMTAFLLSQICKDVGLPAGVLNIVHGLGNEVGSTLVQHPEIKAVSFTGSTTTGRWIAQAVAKDFKKVSLEMGGKNPTLVFADADFEQALDGVLKAAFRNQGQICLCGSRIYIERSLYKKFSEALIEKVKKLKVGDPLEPTTEQGAVVSESHLQKIMSYIDLAQKEGGKILTGGKRASVNGLFQGGYFIEPTLIEGLNSSCRTNQEEIFGPVATIQAFDSEAEAIREANSTRYGLAASIWTRDLSRAHRVARDLESGIVWINTWMKRDLRTPFGGVKESGVGREGGIEALKFFSEVKNVCLDFGGSP